MTSKTARVRTDDLEEALDYLEGLAVILERFHEQGDVLHDPRVQLLIALLSMDSHGAGWEPLRYQSTTGQGWSDLAHNVERLRERLLEGYADAAL